MRRMAVLLIVLAGWSGACGGRSPVAPTNTAPPGATQACRFYATEWTSTYT